MEHLAAQAFVQLIDRHLRNQCFQLVDVGCSGGIHPAWKSFTRSLRAFGFDPNIVECRRLAAEETSAAVEYIPAFVGLPPMHPFALKLKAQGSVSSDIWDRPVGRRLSTGRTLEIRGPVIEQSSNEEKTIINSWRKTELADPLAPIYLAEFLKERNTQIIDFIKIDVDGTDYEVLQSIDKVLDTHCVLGLGIEVTYPGSSNDTDNVFHNVDRFMRSKGFELFDLTTRRYSVRSLPGRYELFVPAQTVFGRVIQGDALFIRDICSPEHESVADILSVEQLMKLAAIFSLFGLPDCAAEVLTRFQTRLEPFLDVNVALDLLVHQAAESNWDSQQGYPCSYQDYIEAFENDASMFYPVSMPSPSQLRYRLRQLEAAVETLESERRKLDQAWRDQWTEAQKRQEELNQAWRDQVIAAQKRYDEIDQAWRDQAIAAQKHSIDIDQAWSDQAIAAQKRYEEIDQAWRDQAIAAQKRYGEIEEAWKQQLELARAETIREKRRTEMQTLAWSRFFNRMAAADGRPKLPAYQIERHIPLHDASIESFDPFEIRTASEQWSYSVEFFLNRNAMPPEGVQVTLQAEVHEGAIGIGVLKNDGSFVHEVHIAVDDKLSIVHILAEPAADAGSMVIRNISPKGPSRARLKILAVVPLA